MRIRLGFVFSVVALSFSLPVNAKLQVIFLTNAEPKVLMEWSEEQLIQNLKDSKFRFEALLFEKGTAKLSLDEKASIDLVTLYGKDKVARLPRFMVWKDLVRIRKDRQGLETTGLKSRLQVPKELFDVREVQKIELSQAALAYPGTRLTLRTNPSASRGEKLYVQSCLACHSLSTQPKINHKDLMKLDRSVYDSKHLKFGVPNLSDRDLRGLHAYSESLK